jgi:hypothetical protein
MSNPQTIIITGNISNNTSEVLVYPIPAHEQLFVKGASLESGSWSVTNILNQKSRPPLQATPDGSTIDIRDLSSGIYFLRVNDGKTWTTFKFIKE